MRLGSGDQIMKAYGCGRQGSGGVNEYDHVLDEIVRASILTNRYTCILWSLGLAQSSEYASLGRIKLG